MFQGMQYVYAVYKEKSFSKAAEKLFISQPSLSANIKRVEKKVGYAIFDRSVKPVALTDCGEYYIRAVERILEIEKEFEDYVDELGELKRGSLQFGGSNLFSSWMLPHMMAEFSRKYPHIRLSLVEDSTAALSNLLQRGDVDFVVDNSILDPNIFDRKIFRQESMLLAVPESYPVNQKLKEYQIPKIRIGDRIFLEKETKEVPLKAFENAPFIMLRRENDTGRRAREICAEQRFSPNVVFELDQQMTAYNITCSGMGISFVGDAMVPHFPPSAEVVYYRLGGKHSCRNIYLYWKKGRYMTAVMRAFLDSMLILSELPMH